MTTNYTIREYATGDAIGECDLTDEHFARHERYAQQPEGLIALADIPGHVVLSDVMDGATIVFLE